MRKFKIKSKKRGEMTSQMIYLILAIFVLVAMIGLLIYFKDDIYAWIKNLPDYDLSKDEEIGIEGVQDLRKCEIRIAKVVDSARVNEVKQALERNFIPGITKDTKTGKLVPYEIKEVLFCEDKDCNDYLTDSPVLFLKEKDKLNGKLYFKSSTIDYKDSYLGSFDNGKFSIFANLNDKIKNDPFYSMSQVRINQLNNAFYEELFICAKKKT